MHRIAGLAFCKLINCTAVYKLLRDLYIVLRPESYDNGTRAGEYALFRVEVVFVLYCSWILVMAQFNLPLPEITVERFPEIVDTI